jgi:exosortase
MSPPTAILDRATPAAWAVVAFLGTAAGAFTWLLWPEWSSNPDLSHAFFMPVIFVLLIWESRRQGPLRWLQPGPLPLLAVAATLAAAVLCFGLAGIFAATLAWNHALVCTLLAATLAGFLFAGLLLFADTRVRLVPLNWTAASAVFLWLLAVPLPDGTYARLTLGLQHWVTGSVLHTLHLLGVPARQHGNIIELATATVGVEEACSGIRSLISCLFAGFFFAAWLVRHPLARLVLIVAAPLLALGMNFLRSLLLTLLANAGKDIAGLWHDATGYAVLGVTAAVLAGLAVLLESKEPAPAPASAAPAPAALPRWPARLFWLAAATTVTLGLFYIAATRPASLPPRPAPDLATLLPASPPGWQTQTPTDLYQFSSILQTSHLAERTYLRTDAAGQLVQLTVYIAYWAPGQASVSRVASHTPDACWPGAGWSADTGAGATEPPTLPGLALPPGEQRRFRNANGFTQNVWFWHIYDGRVISYRDPYSLPALFQIALRYGFRKPGDQAFIRISSNRPWAELRDEPLVREIFANLTALGL